MSSKPVFPYRIVVDTREQLPWRFPAEVAVTRGALKSGDYSLEGFEERIAIERKSLSDLVGCVTAERERFVRELERLKAMEFSLVVVEANLDDVLTHAYRSRALPDAVVGSTVAWTLDYCPVLFAGDASNAARLALKFLTKWHARNGQEAAA